MAHGPLVLVRGIYFLQGILTCCVYTCNVMKIGNPVFALFLVKASCHWNLGYTYIES